MKSVAMNRILTNILRNLHRRHRITRKLLLISQEIISEKTLSIERTVSIEDTRPLRIEETLDCN